MRFANAENILDRVNQIKRASAEGSIPYLTPYMASQGVAESGYKDSHSGRPSVDYEGKMRELDEIVRNTEYGIKPEEEVLVDPVGFEEPKESSSPVEEIDPERKAAQDKWRKLLANHIEEGKRYGRTEQESMDRVVWSSRTMTREENEEFRWAFEGTTKAPGWRKWGGGRKQGSGGGVRKAGEKTGPGLGFHVGQAVRGITARFSPTQGKVGGGKKNTSTKGGTTAPGNQGAGAMRSDIQLKENITYINTSPEGHSIYEWNYKGEPESRRYQGVMAQELLETTPHAVVTMDDGYLGVKYDEIDVKFTTA